MATPLQRLNEHLAVREAALAYYSPPKNIKRANGDPIVHEDDAPIMIALREEQNRINVLRQWIADCEKKGISIQDSDVDNLINSDIAIMKKMPVKIAFFNMARRDNLIAQIKILGLNPDESVTRADKQAESALSIGPKTRSGLLDRLHKGHGAVAKSTDPGVFENGLDTPIKKLEMAVNDLEKAVNAQVAKQGNRPPAPQQARPVNPTQQQAQRVNSPRPQPAPNAPQQGAATLMGLAPAVRLQYLKNHLEDRKRLLKNYNQLNSLNFFKPTYQKDLIKHEINAIKELEGLVSALGGSNSQPSPENIALINKYDRCIKEGVQHEHTDHNKQMIAHGLYVTEKAERLLKDAQLPDNRNNAAIQQRAKEIKALLDNGNDALSNGVINHKGIPEGTRANVINRVIRLHQLNNELENMMYGQQPNPNQKPEPERRPRLQVMQHHDNTIEISGTDHELMANAFKVCIANGIPFKIPEKGSAAENAFRRVHVLNGQDSLSNMFILQQSNNGVLKSWPIQTDSAETKAAQKACQNAHKVETKKDDPEYNVAEKIKEKVTKMDNAKQGSSATNQNQHRNRNI